MNRRLFPLVAAALATVVLASGPAETATAPAPRATTYRFVAAPDFLNQDVGDVRRLRTWHRGLPNSWTPELQQSIDRFLDEIAAQDPASVLVPGDLVEGHWGRDDRHTRIFGPTHTERQRVRALRRAADFYFGTYASRFRARGLTLHAAVGDHDIGDNDWNNRTAYTRFKRRHLGAFKHAFVEHFTRGYRDRPAGTPTAYATRLAPDVLLVSLDEFHRVRGDVRLEVVGAQLRWLERTLARARRQHVRWVIVQGHNPVITPVRNRSSSNGHIRGGASSPLWRVMTRYGVDLYLCGEVHDTTLRRQGGLTQLSTGGLLYTGHATYLLADVHDDRIDLDVREFSGDTGGPLLWQTSGPRTRSRTTYASGSASVGTMSLLANGRAVGQTGKLRTYRR